MNQTRFLHEIASDIRRSWPNVNYAAEPYLNAMGTLGSIDDRYMYDSAKSIVLYFLSNARTWKGESARCIKKELNAMVK